MKRIALIIIIECILFPQLYASHTTIYGNSFTPIEMSEKVLIKTVILRQDGKNCQDCVSADLIEVDGKVRISYKGETYEIFPVTNNTTYDSAVIINGIRYLFRQRPRPYE